MPPEELLSLVCRIPGTSFDDVELWGGGAFNAGKFLEEAMTLAEIAKGSETLRRFTSRARMTRGWVVMNLPPGLSLLQRNYVPYHMQIFTLMEDEGRTLCAGVYWAPGMRHKLVYIKNVLGNQLAGLAASLDELVVDVDSAEVTRALVAGYNKVIEDARQLEFDNSLGG